MARLHVFDMDGTLLRGAAVEEMSRHLGCFDEASALERAYIGGEAIDELFFWDRVMELWAEATEEELDQAFAASPWMDGIREVFADIVARGEHSIVISQSPLFVVRRLEAWGAGATFATTVERGVPCRHDQLLREQDKVDITLRMLDDLGLTPAECVAYGDSTSDVTLFGQLPHTVAVNASPIIRSLATSTYDGASLFDAYRIGRALLERALVDGSARPMTTS